MKDRLILIAVGLLTVLASVGLTQVQVARYGRLELSDTSATSLVVGGGVTAGTGSVGVINTTGHLNDTEATAAGITNEIKLFETTCPSGFTDLSTVYGGRYLVIMPSGGTLSLTGGTALTNGENRPAGSHNHLITDPGHFHGFTTWTQTNEFMTNGAGAIPTTPSSPNTNSATTGITINAGGGGTSGQTGVAGTNAPYVQLRACRKN